MSYEFTNEEIKAYQIKDSKMHAFLPFVSKEWAEKNKRETIHAIDISMIAEVELTLDNDPCNDNTVPVKSIHIEKMHYYDDFSIPVLVHNWDDHFGPSLIRPYHETNPSYSLRFHREEFPYVLSTRDTSKMQPTNILFPTLKDATKHAIGYQTKPVFTTCDDKPHTIETLDINLFKRAYTTRWMKTPNDYPTDLYNKYEIGYVLFKPTVEAHIKRINDIIIADRVIPICLLYDARIEKENIHKPNLGTEECVGRTFHDITQIIPKYGVPTNYRFGKEFLTTTDRDISFYKTAKIRK